MRGAGIAVVLVILAALACGCGREPPRFDVDSVLPPVSSPLRLNEPLEIRFTDDVDPSSVHARSVRVVSSTGGAAPR